MELPIFNKFLINVNVAVSGTDILESLIIVIHAFKF